tara:strand:+ start:34200 stop:35498 length:1299 start_codon:yes stop_codon:yes gene_type:complete
MFSKLFGKSKSVKPTELVYDDAKRLARDDDTSVRANLAKRTDVPQEILYFLAEDPSPEVRRHIAENNTAPQRADLLLAKDTDDSVRGSLAAKIVRMAPGLSHDEQDRLRRITYEALQLLARDQAVRVRQTIAEALKELADAPPDVIRRLAWDVEAAVATPVLRFSPVLTEADLIEIIRARPSPGAVSAISQRDGVTENLSDAIVAADDVEALAFLLVNPSAQLREETLDRVIDRAVDVDILHMPLAMRPKLRSQAAVKISRFVAEDILTRMLAREDLSMDTIEAVRAVVHKRLGDAEAMLPDDGVKSNAPKSGVQVDDDDIFDKAAKEWADGKLDEQVLLGAISDGEKKYALSIIALMADMPISVVEKACATQSAKGCVALAWQASLMPKTSEIIQQKLATIPPGEILRSVAGKYPLSDADMAWQIDFIRDL